MKQIYIDFDSTLFDTAKLKSLLNILIAEKLHDKTDVSKENALDKVLTLRRIDKLGYYHICEKLENEFKLKKNTLLKLVDDFLFSCGHLVYDDSVEFLKNLQAKDYDVNILTYSSPKDIEFQMKKMLGSGLLEFVDNIVICSKPKGELALDYKNAIFIDDNTDQLSSLFRAGVKENRLFRIRRDGAKYSKVEIVDFNPIETTSLKEINL